MERGWSELASLLARVRGLVEGSVSSDWSSRSPADVVVILDREIVAVGSGGGLVDGVELAALFAPTGAVQEIAMSSGWAGEYMELSAAFDVALGETS